jgi:nicotinate-nucleotide adenylyltransferase
MPQHLPAQIALFGTSADPPTIGHGAILQYLTQHYDHVAIWAAENPFKSQQTPLAQRHHMLQLLLADAPSGERPLSPEALRVYPELSHTRTWHSFEAARALWPSAEFTLVVGADLIQQITQWYRAIDLLQVVKLLVIPRQGYDLQAADLAPIYALGTPVAIAQIIPPKTASSEYRKQGQQCLTTPITTPSIQAYIEREQLYA